MNRRAIALGALTLAAFGLRLVRIDDESAWLDEAWSMRMIELPLGEFFRVLRVEDGHPPLYLLLLRAWALAFPTPAGLRAFSALCVAASVPFAFAFARRLVSEPAGWWTAALVTASPALFHFGQEIRSYALVFLLASISCAFWARLLDGEAPRRVWLAHALATAALLWTHYMTVWLILAQQWPMLRRRRWIAWQALAAAVFLPWAPSAWAHVSRVTSDFWIEPPTAISVLESFQTLAVFLRSPGLTAVWGVAALSGLVLALRRGRQGAILATLLMLPPVGELVASLRQPVYYTRTFLYVALPLLAIAAVAVAAIPRRVGQAAAGAALLAASAIGIGWQLRNVEKEDWRGAVRLVRQHRDPDDALLIYPSYCGYALDPYSPGPYTGLGGTDVMDPSPPAEFDAPSAPQLWLVLRYENFDPDGAIKRTLERGGYAAEEVLRFNGVTVIRYRR